MIYRGQKDVLNILRTGRLDIIGHLQAGINQKDWLAGCIEYVEKAHLQGFTEDNAKVVGMSSVLNSPVVLYTFEGKGILLREYNTKDKGPLLVWAYEMSLYPTYVEDVLLEAKDILKVHGMRLTDEGRPDALIILDTEKHPFENMSSRVKKAFNAGTKLGLTTRRVSNSDFLNSFYRADTSRIQAENLLYFYTYDHNLPAPTEEDYLKVSKADLLMCMSNAFSSPSYLMFETVIGEEVIAQSIIFRTSVGWYWVGSYLGRSSRFNELRGKTNLLYVVLSQLVDMAYNLEVPSLNLGITTFEYKRDFTKDVTYVIGISNS